MIGVHHTMSGFRWQLAAILAGLALLAPPTAVTQPRPWGVAPTPSVRLGTGEAQSELFDAVAGAVRLPDGRIVVGNRGDYALLVFSRSGQLERRLGRKGKGPGEVTYLGWLFRCGNGVFTGDLDGDRVQEFSLEMAYRRAFRFSGQSYRVSCNARQQFLHMGWDDPNSMRAGVHRANVRYWVTGADSGAGVTLGMMPGSERFGETQNGKIVGSGPLVFGREPRVAITDQTAFIALGDSLALRAFSLTGAPRAPLTAPWVPRPVTDADLDAEIERQVGALGEKMRKPVERSLRAMPRGRTLPATRDLLIDAAGLIWVQATPSAAQSTVEWTVFRPTGGVVTRVQLPAALTVYEIGRDYILGSVINEDSGAAEVVLHSLRR